MGKDTWGKCQRVQGVQVGCYHGYKNHIHVQYIKVLILALFTVIFYVATK